VFVPSSVFGIRLTSVVHAACCAMSNCWTCGRSRAGHPQSTCPPYRLDDPPKRLYNPVTYSPTPVTSGYFRYDGTLKWNPLVEHRVKLTVLKLTAQAIFQGHKIRRADGEGYITALLKGEDGDAKEHVVALEVAMKAEWEVRVSAAAAARTKHHSRIVPHEVVVQPSLTSARHTFLPTPEPSPTKNGNDDARATLLGTPNTNNASTISLSGHSNSSEPLHATPSFTRDPLAKLWEWSIEGHWSLKVSATNTGILSFEKDVESPFKPPKAFALLNIPSKHSVISELTGVQSFDGGGAGSMIKVGLEWASLSRRRAGSEHGTGVIEFRSVYGMGRTDFKLYGSLNGYDKDGMALEFSATRSAERGGFLKVIYSEICARK